MQQPSETNDATDPVEAVPTPPPAQYSPSKKLKMINEHKSQIYGNGSDCISDYLERMDPRALRKLQTSTNKKKETKSPLYRRSTCLLPKSLQFKLVDEGVDIASSDSEEDSESVNTTKQEDDGSYDDEEHSHCIDEAITEENSAEYEESPKPNLENNFDLKLFKMAQPGDEAESPEINIQ